MNNYTKPPITTSVERRMRKYVHRSSDHNACWPWTGYVSPEGYGRISVSGRAYQAHRIALWLVRDFDPSLIVCHTCDNPLCCNPNHLYAGTDADNSEDKVRRGRTRPCRGEENKGGGKLTEGDVLAIKRRYRPYAVTQQRLAAEYGVTVSMVKKIIQGRNWRHVSASA